ncbi:hypothetical protein RMATCC62417_18414 [Rhizopus microsporus]|nr:hypothetical protein RMATCC62417_18414 [Rhizopus microsporus]
MISTNKESNHSSSSSNNNRSESTSMTYSHTDPRDRYRLQYPLDRYDDRNYRSSRSDTTSRQHSPRHANKSSSLEDQKNIPYRERIKLAQRKINNLRNTIKDCKDHSIINATRDHIAILHKLIDSLEVGMREEEENTCRRERRDHPSSYNMKQADKPTTTKNVQVTSDRSNPATAAITTTTATGDIRQPSISEATYPKIEDKWPTVRDFISSFEDNLMHQMTSFSQSLPYRSSNETKKEDHRECQIEKHEQSKSEPMTIIPNPVFDPSSLAPSTSTSTTTTNHTVNLLAPEDSAKKGYISSDRLLQVYNCRQNLGETLPNYINRFTQLCRNAGIEDTRFLAIVFHQSLCQTVMAVVQEQVLTMYESLEIKPSDCIREEDTYSTYIAKLRLLWPTMHQNINRLVQLEKVHRSQKRKGYQESNDTRAEKRSRLSPAGETLPNMNKRLKNPCRFCKTTEYTKQHKCSEFYRARALKQLKAQKEAKREEEYNHTSNGPYRKHDGL